MTEEIRVSSWQIGGHVDVVSWRMAILIAMRLFAAVWLVDNEVGRCRRRIDALSRGSPVTAGVISGSHHFVGREEVRFGWSGNGAAWMPA